MLTRSAAEPRPSTGKPTDGNSNANEDDCAKEYLRLIPLDDAHGNEFWQADDHRYDDPPRGESNQRPATGESEKPHSGSFCIILMSRHIRSVPQRGKASLVGREWEIRLVARFNIGKTSWACNENHLACVGFLVPERE